MGLDRSTLYLSRDAVEGLGLSMARIIEVVESALVEKANGRVQMPAKHWMEARPTRWFGGMSSIVPSVGYSAMKWQSGSSENMARGVPYLTGMLFLNRLDDGLVSAVMDSTWLTQQRTAAASAVAVKYLAKADATAFAVLGCGVQARSHLEALQIVMPNLREVVAYDIVPAAAEAFARVVEQAGLRARVVHSAREAVEATDVVITAGPIEPDLPRSIDVDWLHPGLLGVTLDYDCYWKPAAFNKADTLVTDDFAQIEHIKEYGYFVGCNAPHCELGAIAAGLAPRRMNSSDVIIVMNMGVAVEDVATAKEIYDLAIEKKVGTVLPL